MYQINLNKKLVSNLIFGSSLFGISASTITQVQGIQRSHAVRQQAREYAIDATGQLRGRLGQRNISMEECIRFVRDKEADPNVQDQSSKATSGTRRSETLLPSWQSETGPGTIPS
jgi:hypothetical protein